MKEIQITGDTQSGKTEAFLDFICSQSEAVVISPCAVRSDWLKREAMLRGCNKNIRFTSSIYAIAGSGCSVIALHDVDAFPETKEGNPILLARDRLKVRPFGTLLWCIQEPCVFTSHPKWISKAVWYKPWTWSRGYWIKEPTL